MNLLNITNNFKTIALFAIAISILSISALTNAATKSEILNSVKVDQLLEDEGIFSGEIVALEPVYEDIEVQVWEITIFQPMNDSRKGGSMLLPRVAFEVYVSFELGDVNQPIVIGSLWNRTDTPPETSNYAEITLERGFTATDDLWKWQNLNYSDGTGKDHWTVKD